MGRTQTVYGTCWDDATNTSGPDVIRLGIILARLLLWDLIRLLGSLVMLSVYSSFYVLFAFCFVWFSLDQRDTKERIFCFSLPGRYNDSLQLHTFLRV